MASEQANNIAAALDRLWERFLPEIRARVEILESAARSGANGEITSEQRAQAAGAAHKLAGTLGTFGLARGTSLARELECLYAGGDGLTPEIALSSAAELRALMTEGKRRRTDHLDLFIRPSPLEHSRLAVIVARFGHTAPQRNQLRRRLREILRRSVLPSLPEPAELAVRARPAAYGAGFDRLRAELVGTLCPSSPASPS